jgi:hypothetical protein
MSENPYFEIALTMGKTIGTFIVTRETLIQRNEDTTSIDKDIEHVMSQLKRTIALAVKKQETL